MTTKEVEEAIKLEEKMAQEYTELCSSLLRSTQEVSSMSERGGGGEESGGLAQVMQTYGAQLGRRDPTIADLMRQISSVLGHVYASQQAMDSTLQTRFLAPLNDMVQRGRGESKTVARNFEKSMQAYVAAEAKVQQTTRARGGVSLSKLEEAERARNEALDGLRAVAVVTAQTLQAITQRSRIQMARGVCDYLRAYREFFAAGLAEIDRLAPEFDRFSADTLERVIKEAPHGASDSMSRIEQWADPSSAPVDKKPTHAADDPGGLDSTAMAAAAATANKAANRRSISFQLGAPVASGDVIGSGPPKTSPVETKSSEDRPTVAVEPSTASTAAAADGAVLSIRSSLSGGQRARGTFLIQRGNSSGGESLSGALTEAGLQAMAASSSAVDDDDDDEGADAQSGAQLARAIADTTADGDSSALALRVDDVVRVISVNGGVGTGELEGRVGSFAVRHVEMLESVEPRSFDVQLAVKKDNNRVLRIDVLGRTIVMYDPRRQTERALGDELMMVERMWPNLSLRLHYRGQQVPEVISFRRAEQLAWAYDASWLVRNPDAVAAPREQISVFCGTWNLGKAPPPRSLAPFIQRGHDLYFVSLQESDYTPRAGFSSCAVDFYALLTDELGPDYIKITSLSLLAIRGAVFAKRQHYYKISNVKSHSVATGIGNVVGNKGAVAVSLAFNETRVCFIGSHLAAHETKVEDRNQNYRDIVRHLKMSPVGDVMTYYHYVFWAGDLNYRVVLPRERVVALAGKPNGVATLLMADQLLRERRSGNCFFDFREGDVAFRPTYRYCRGSRTYSEEKQRVPSFTDRILWHTLPDLAAEQLTYTAHDEITTSDHSPVSASFRIDTDPVASALRSRDAAAVKLVSLDVRAASARGAVVLTITAECLEGAVCSNGILRDGVASWRPGELPPVRPFVSNRNYLRRQYLFVTVSEKGEKGVDVGHAAISLARCDGSGPVAFQSVLVRNGSLVGTVTGELELTWFTSDTPRATLGVPDSRRVELKSGYLMKKGAKRKNWKRRWFVLSGWDVTYFEHPDAGKALGHVPLGPGCAVETSTEKLHCFHIKTPQRTYVCAADKKRRKEDKRKKKKKKE